jgi:hypothetical protein
MQDKFQTEKINTGIHSRNGDESNVKVNFNEP